MSNIVYYLSIAVIILTPITGIILLLDKFIFAKKRQKDAKLPFWVDWSAFLFPVIAIISIVRCFIFEPFVIPSGSMQPTLYAGDMIVADKWSLGVRYPIFNHRIFSQPGDGVERGDIAIFQYPKNKQINYIKRIVGLPGDVIDYQNKRLFINGQPAGFKYLSQARAPESNQSIAEEILPRENAEDLVHQIQYLNRATVGDGLSGKTILHFPVTVPEGHYLTMGDNRDNSEDSRYWGFVPDENLVGKARFIWMNYNCIFRMSDCGHIGTVLH